MLFAVETDNLRVLLVSIRMYLLSIQLFLLLLSVSILCYALLWTIPDPYYHTGGTACVVLSSPHRPPILVACCLA